MLLNPRTLQRIKKTSTAANNIDIMDTDTLMHISFSISVFEEDYCDHLICQPKYTVTIYFDYLFKFCLGKIIEVDDIS